ncbi:MAG: endonuclease V [Gemmataceae bacterium]
MVKVCVDVDYREDQAVAAAVLFHDWGDPTAAGRIVQTICPVAAYEPGAFYRRELPCLMAVLGQVSDPLELVIVDGYVWLQDETRPGLGAHLHAALEGKVPVVGVAKTCFTSAKGAVAVVRGCLASRPLYVTAVGVDVTEAAERVRGMHGPHRIPTLLKLVDRVCRDG